MYDDTRFQRGRHKFRRVRSCLSPPSSNIAFYDTAVCCTTWCGVRSSFSNSVVQVLLILLLTSLPFPSTASVSILYESPHCMIYCLHAGVQKVVHDVGGVYVQRWLGNNISHVFAITVFGVRCVFHLCLATVVNVRPATRTLFLTTVSKVDWYVDSLYKSTIRLIRVWLGLVGGVFVSLSGFVTA